MLCFSEPPNPAKLIDTPSGVFCRVAQILPVKPPNAAILDCGTACNALPSGLSKRRCSGGIGEVEVEDRTWSPRHAARTANGLDRKRWLFGEFEKQ
jgi:hypothetical protein